MHKLYHRPNMVPETMKKHDNIHQYNIRHKRDFHAVPINTTAYGKRTMAYKGRHLWNQLPKDLKETDDTLLFKTKRKDQFFFEIPILQDQITVD